MFSGKTAHTQFIAVDFYESGDLIKAVKDLNQKIFVK